MAKKKNTVRADGRIAVQVYIGRVDGKRKYKTVYGSTQKEADEKALQIKLKMRKGIDVSRLSDTFEDWANRWLESKKLDVCEKRYNSYKSLCKYLKEEFGQKDIGKVLPCDVKQVITKLAEYNPHTKKPSSKQTLSETRMIARQVFDFAIENRATTFNPARASSVSLPAQAPKMTREALTQEQQGWIIHTTHRAQRAAMIMLFSGLRRGELIPLTWDDINLEDHTIQVSKAVRMVNGRPKIKPIAKTKAGNRNVSIPQILVDYLIREKANDFQQSSSGKVKEIHKLVCPSAKGKMMTESAFERLWESYLVELNFQYGNRIDKKGNVAKSKYNRNGLIMTIPHITPHCLRHTFASILYMAGVDVLVASEQLGHANPATTIAIYTHFDELYKIRNIGKVDEYLEKCKSNASQNEHGRGRIFAKSKKTPGTPR